MALNIPGNLLAPAPQKTAFDYENEFANADLMREQRRQAMLQNAFAMQQQKAAAQERQRVLGEQAGVRNAISGLPQGYSRADLYGALERLGTQTALGQADSLRKSEADYTDKMAGADEKKAKAEKERDAVVSARLGHYRDALAGVTTPGDAQRWLVAQYQDPVISDHVQRTIGPMMQAVAKVPQNPEELGPWLLKNSLGIKGYQDYLEKQATQKREQTTADAANANRPLVIGPGGQFIPNEPLQKFELAKAKASAAQTNIDMGSGQKGFDNEIKLRKDFQQEPIYKAYQEMKSAYGQIGASLKEASPSGDLAAATKIMKLLDPGSVVRESELGMAMAATGMLDRVTSYASNIINGTKLTPQQRVQFQSLADALMAQSVEQYNGKHAEYMQLGGEYGLNAGRALGPAAPAVGAKKPAKKAPDASGWSIQKVE